MLFMVVYVVYFVGGTHKAGRDLQSQPSCRRTGKDNRRAMPGCLHTVTALREGKELTAVSLTNDCFAGERTVAGPGDRFDDAMYACCRIKPTT